MKVTLTSTSMMKPILYSQTENSVLVNQSKEQHPQRILGLLDQPHSQLSENIARTYRRPDSFGAPSVVSCWQHFLHVANATNEQCIAVFGFEFNGDETWYQLWNTTTQSLCWLMHEGEMDYQPYAIIAMDALVSLLPNWNGELFLALSSANDAHAHSGKFTHSQKNECEFQISDAATMANGQLWFLVTVNQPLNNQRTPLAAQFAQSGWISQSCQSA